MWSRDGGRPSFCGLTWGATKDIDLSFSIQNQHLAHAIFFDSLVHLVVDFGLALLAQSDCDVELDAELGVGPNGAYLFEASNTDAMDASFQWNVNGSILEEGFDNTLEWHVDILGAPFGKCVVMETTEGCVAEDCFTSADLVPECVDDDLIDPT